MQVSSNSVDRVTMFFAGLCLVVGILGYILITSNLPASRPSSLSILAQTERGANFTQIQRPYSNFNVGDVMIPLPMEGVLPAGISE